MEPRSSDIKVIGYGLAIVYGVVLFVYLLAVLISCFDNGLIMNSSLFAGRFSSIPEFYSQALTVWVLFLPMWVASLAVAKFKDWGRKLLVAMGIVTAVFTIYQAVGQSHKLDFVSVNSLLMSALIFLFFLQPRVRNQFVTSGDVNSRRILVVDDDRGLIKMLKTGLAVEGFTVLTAFTGEDGLRMAKSRKPDLIVLDVILPGIKGREVCVKLKEDPETRSIPVIFLTSKDSPDDVKAELSAGALSHLTKPVNSQKLVGEIKKILDL